ncbi:MAG: hypothetical protein LAN84_09850 [Acidobacteriia bacterium]|nr:hypothetical protein [Terriglobia bacterium]
MYERIVHQSLKLIIFVLALAAFADTGNRAQPSAASLRGQTPEQQKRVPGSQSNLPRKNAPQKADRVMPPSKEFVDLAEDAMDAIDRESGQHLGPEIVFQTAKLEAERLIQKLLRTAKSPSEKNVYQAVASYFVQVETCRITEPLGNDAFKKCLDEETAARDGAFRSLAIYKKGSASRRDDRVGE